MRVAFIAGTYQPEHCGVVDYTARLRRALQEQGVSSLVLTTRKAAARSSVPDVVGITQDWNLADLPSLARAVHAADADLLHIQHAAGTYGFKRAIFLLPLLLRASGYRAPIVTTVHEYGWWEWQPGAIPSRLLGTLKQWGQQHAWWDREDGFLLTLSDALITTTAEVEATVHSRLPRFKERLSRIPIGVNIEIAPVEQTAARQMVRRACGWQEETMILVFFGFLHPVKGLETLLAAFKDVLATHPQARLLLMGGAESLALQGEHAARYKEKLVRLVKELDITEQVRMTDYLSGETVSHWLAGADIGVLPFTYGITLKSGSLLTLFAHRLPVISTHHDPPDPILARTQSVKLVPPRDRHSLASALRALIDNPSLRCQLGAAGHDLVRDCDWHTIAQRHWSIYQAAWERRLSYK
jgi:glycosyltransferase involved in cell wall biosynthesis